MLFSVVFITDFIYYRFMFIYVGFIVMVSIYLWWVKETCKVVDILLECIFVCQKLCNLYETLINVCYHGFHKCLCLSLLLCPSNLEFSISCEFIVL